jgi:N-methylhydantoinase A/oxoprolinase/acetone carboxylase beta subunit
MHGRPWDGPLIVEDDDATTVIPPGWRALLDAGGNIVTEKKPDTAPPHIRHHVTG